MAEFRPGWSAHCLDYIQCRKSALCMQKEDLKGISVDVWAIFLLAVVAAACFQA